MTPYSEPRVERVNLFELEQGQQAMEQEDMLGKRT